METESRLISLNAFKNAFSILFLSIFGGTFGFLWNLDFEFEIKKVLCVKASNVEANSFFSWVSSSSFSSIIDSITPSPNISHIDSFFIAFICIFEPFNFFFTSFKSILLNSFYDSLKNLWLYNLSALNLLFGSICNIQLINDTASFDNILGIK